jgi:hypothetical protein
MTKIKIIIKNNIRLNISIFFELTFIKIIPESTEPIIKPKKLSNLKKQQSFMIESDSESESEDYIATMTEIIETYNKTNNVDEIKLKKLSDSKPDMLFDNIIGEIVKTSKAKVKQKQK